MHADLSGASSVMGPVELKAFADTVITLANNAGNDSMAACEQHVLRVTTRFKELLAEWDKNEVTKLLEETVLDAEKLHAVAQCPCAQKIWKMYGQWKTAAKVVSPMYKMLPQACLPSSDMIDEKISETIGRVKTVVATNTALNGLFKPLIGSETRPPLLERAKQKIDALNVAVRSKLSAALEAPTADTCGAQQLSSNAP